MYIALVVANHPKDDRDFLFYAPAWCGLEVGDDITVDTQRGEFPAKIKAICTLEENSDAYNFIVTLAHAHLPLRKVLSKVEYKTLKYMEDKISETL